MGIGSSASGSNIGVAGNAPTIADSGDLDVTNTGIQGVASGSNLMNVGVSGRAEDLKQRGDFIVV